MAVQRQNDIKRTSEIFRCLNDVVIHGLKHHVVPECVLRIFRCRFDLFQINAAMCQV